MSTNKIASPYTFVKPYCSTDGLVYQLSSCPRKTVLSMGYETNHCFLSDTDSTPARRDKQGRHSGLGSNSSGGTTTSIEPCPGFEPDAFLRGVNRITTGVNLLGKLQPTVLRLALCDVHIKQIALHSATTVSGLGHVTRGRFLTQADTCGS